MPIYSHPSSALVRRLRPSEAALASHLALASLWAVELPDQPLEDIEALLRRLPSIADILAGNGAYFVAEVAGVASAGGGWSALPVEGRSTAPLAVLSPLFFVDPGEAHRLRACLLACIEADIARAEHAEALAIVPFGSASEYERLGYSPIATETLGRKRLPVARLRKVLAAELAEVA